MESKKKIQTPNPDLKLMDQVRQVSCKETSGSLKFPGCPREHMPWSSGRNTARAPLGREFPSCTLSVVQRVPSSAIDHVSASPPLIPDGRISRVRLAVSDLHALSPEKPSHIGGGLNVRPYTPLTGMVYLPDSPILRLPTLRILCPSSVSSLRAITVPRAPLPLQGVTLRSAAFPVT